MAARAGHPADPAPSRRRAAERLRHRPGRRRAASAWPASTRPSRRQRLAELRAVFARLDRRSRRGRAGRRDRPRANRSSTRSLDLRYRGVDASLTVPCPAGHTAASVRRSFRRPSIASCTATCTRVARWKSSPRASKPAGSRRRRWPLRAQSRRRASPPARAPSSVYFDGQHCATRRLRSRGSLQPGDRIAGPAIVCETASTAVIDPGWQAEVLSRGELLVTASDGRAARPSRFRPPPIR